MKKRILFIILLFLLSFHGNAPAQNSSPETDNAEIFDDTIRIDGRTYKIAPGFSVPSNIDVDSPVKLNFTDDTHELLSIERLVEDTSTGGSLEYHFGIVDAISKPGIDLSYRVYVDGIGYLFTSSTRIDEKAGFLEKHASVALVTKDGTSLSCRVISSNSAVPENDIFWGEVEEIRQNTDTAEISVDGIRHVISDTTDTIGNVLAPGAWVFGYETGGTARFVSVIPDRFPDPDEITAFRGNVDFIGAPRQDSSFYITVADATMRVTPDSAAVPELSAGDYVMGYRLGGEVLLISRFEENLPEPFLYDGIISKKAVNAFQIDDVIIDYDDNTWISGRFEEGKYALVFGLGDYAEMIYIVPDSCQDYSYHAASGVISGIGKPNADGRQTIRLDEDIYYMTRDSISVKNLAYDEIGTALYRGMNQISIIDILEKPADRGRKFYGKISSSIISGSGDSALITIENTSYVVPLTAYFSGFPDLSGLNPGTLVEGYAYENEVLAVSRIKGAGLLGILNPPWLKYAAAGGAAAILFLWIFAKLAGSKASWHTGSFDVGPGDTIILNEGNGRADSYAVDPKLFDFLMDLDEKTVSVKVRRGRIVEIR